MQGGTEFRSPDSCQINGFLCQIGENMSNARLFIYFTQHIHINNHASGLDEMVFRKVEIGFVDD